ncbi:MAG: sensor histidine kinase [Clostridium sp.]|nr:sensor histidine kinase [Clostridium sp.]
MTAIIPMLSGYLLLVQILNMVYQNHLDREAESTLSMAKDSLDGAFSEIYNAIGILCEDEEITAFLETENDASTGSVYRKLYTAAGECASYASISLYDKDGVRRMTVADNKYINNKLSLNWNILYKAARHPEEFVVCNARLYEGEKRIEYLRVGRAVQAEDGTVEGYVIATIIKDNFDNMLKGFGQENEGVLYVMDNFREIVYFSGESYSGEIVSAKNELFTMEPPCMSMRKDSVYYMDYHEGCQLYIMYRQPTALLNHMKGYVLGIALISVILTIFACLLLSYYVSRLIYKPIQRMQYAIGEIKEGNYDIHIEVSSEDELGQLSESFNAMSRHLADNTKRLIQRERELSSANIKMMQAQLNPHFLYNTLDTMKWIAKANGLQEIVSLSSNLAQILRMSISARPTIRLSEEIALVTAYTEIQEIRFEDKFELLVEVPEPLMDCMVPKLILQPIVENSIIHGFAEREKGTVWISAYEAGENKFQIVVQDDGVGIPQDKLEQLNCGKLLPHEEESGHVRIGFYNVNAIIRLHYGEQYGLYAESEKGVGTRVYITLPKIGKMLWDGG